MMFRLSQRSIKRLEGVNNVLKLIAIQGIIDSPIDFGIPLFGGLRTADDQLILFKRGVSKCDGYRRKSYHQSGKAFDIYAYVNRKASWDPKHYEPIAKHLQAFAKEKFNIKLEWGGNFRSFIDMPHFQIR